MKEYRIAFLIVSVINVALTFSWWVAERNELSLEEFMFHATTTTATTTIILDK